MTQGVITPNLEQYDKHFFYCVRKDGAEEMVLANHQDDVGEAILVMSLEEVERIRAALVARKRAVVDNIDAILESTGEIEGALK